MWHEETPDLLQTKHNSHPYYESNAPNLLHWLHVVHNPRSHGDKDKKDNTMGNLTENKDSSTIIDNLYMHDGLLHNTSPLKHWLNASNILKMLIVDKKNTFNEKVPDTNFITTELLKWTRPKYHWWIITIMGHATKKVFLKYWLRN